MTGDVSKGVKSAVQWWPVGSKGHRGAPRGKTVVEPPFEDCDYFDVIMRIGRPIRRARGFVARGSNPPPIAVMSLAPAAFAVGHFASLAIRVTVRGAAIADPCARGKPLVRGAAQRTKGAAEEDRHGVKGRRINLHASGDGFLRRGATDHDHAHSAPTATAEPCPWEHPM